MATQRSAVVVDGNAPDRTNTVRCSKQPGIEVRSARSFDEAKTLLAAERPHLLITDLRLGQYNGLHLVLRSRSDHPEMAPWSPAASPTRCSRPKRIDSTRTSCSSRSPALSCCEAVASSLDAGATEISPVASETPRVAPAPLTPDLC